MNLLKEILTALVDVVTWLSTGALIVILGFLTYPFGWIFGPFIALVWLAVGWEWVIAKLRRIGLLARAH